MPEALRITLIVLGIIVGTWILLFIVDLIFVGSYLTIFKKHKRAMTVILFTKLENMKRLFSILHQSGINIDARLTSLLNDIREEDFEEPASQACDKSKNVLSYLKDEVMFVANQHKELIDDADFIQAKNNVLESDAIYRSNVTMYNADVLGYNYWIRFFPCAFVFKMFRVKKKEIIS